MPFTLSHAAAVLPGIRRSGAGRGPLVASALVMGSLAPDMTYFADSLIPGAMSFGDVTHSVWGVLTVDAVTAAVLVGLWLMVREPLVALLPGRWRGPVHTLCGRAVAGQASGGAGGVVLPLSGHRRGHARRVGPVHPPGPLGHTGAAGAGRDVRRLPLYTYVQYGSSALALVVLCWFGYGALRRVPPGDGAGAPTGLTRRSRRLAVGVLAGCTLAGVLHRCLRWYAYWGRIETPIDIIPTACFGAGAGLGVGLLLYGAGMRLRGEGLRPRT